MTPTPWAARRRSRRPMRTMAAAACLPCLPIAQGAAASQGEIDRIRAVIADPAGLAAPGCAVGVFRDGREVGFVAAGAADVAAGRAIGADTQFYAASVSKQFTAMAVMELVVQGKIKLDGDIRAYLPELRLTGRPVTVAMLLHHSAGIRDSLSLLEAAGHTDISRPTRQEALRLLFAQTGTTSDPGTRFDYSNGGYLLLSEIVERVAREPFDAFVARTILTPLGMTRSFIMHGSRSAEPDMARGYRLEGKGLTLSDSYPLFGGSGGLMTTINDLARWDHDIDSGHKVWTPAITELMLASGHYANGSTMRFGGVAYGAGEVVGPNWFSHSGGASGFRTLYARLPSRRLGLAMLCNRADILVVKRTDAILAALDDRPPPLSDSVLPFYRVDGRYRSDELGVTYRIATVPTGLKVDVLASAGEEPPRATWLFGAAGDGSYRYADLRLIPGGQDAGLLLEAGPLKIRFARIDGSID